MEFVLFQVKSLLLRIFKREISSRTFDCKFVKINPQVQRMSQPCVVFYQVFFLPVFCRMCDEIGYDTYHGHGGVVAKY